jgi:hypothetical protein
MEENNNIAEAQQQLRQLASAIGVENQTLWDAVTTWWRGYQTAQWSSNKSKWKPLNESYAEGKKEDGYPAEPNKRTGQTHRASMLEAGWWFKFKKGAGMYGPTAYKGDKPYKDKRGNNHPWYVLDYWRELMHKNPDINGLVTEVQNSQHKELPKAVKKNYRVKPVKNVTK